MIDHASPTHDQRDAVPRVVVVGGGITGLATAWFLKDRAHVTVVEASSVLGGKLQSGELAGVPVELGPDTFLARVPEAVDLCRALGLGDDLVAPATGEANVWTRGRLRTIPKGTLGVPTELASLIRSGVLSPAGVAHALLDIVLPRIRWSGDPTVADVIGSRLGREVLERLVEPLVGGINAGRADALSLASTAPALATTAAANRSLLIGLRRARRSSTDVIGPLFLGVAGGMARLIDRLVERLAETGVQLLTDTRVTAIDHRASPDEYLVDLEATGTAADRVADHLIADRVVLTVPAFSAAALVSEASPDAAVELAAVNYASVAVASLAYRSESFSGAAPSGAGFLVPRREGRLMSACTFSTSKWPNLAGSDGLVMLRASAGRAGDDRIAAMDDAQLVSHLHGELAIALGIRARPEASLVSRWPNGFPQYEPGHAGRVNRIDAALAADLPGVTVAGAAYRGLGIAACIRQAADAARSALSNPSAR